MIYRADRRRDRAPIHTSASIAKALRALWEVREAEHLGKGEADAVPHSRAGLSALLVKLGGKPLPAGFDETPPPPPQDSAPAPNGPNASV
jgi:hypothetical protein